MIHKAYDVALSFAGEDREIVEEVAKALRGDGIEVFYDRWEQADLWGKNLYQHLDQIYRKAARFCLVFLSENYVKKDWTNHELKSAQARAFEEASEYILPIRLDEVEVKGVLPVTGYISMADSSSWEIARLVKEKLSGMPSDLEGALKSESAEERIGALNLIAAQKLVRHRKAVESVLFNDLESGVRAKAAWALDNFHSDSLIPVFIQALYDDDWDVRSTAGWGLVHHGHNAVPSLAEAVNSEAPERVKRMANHALERIAGRNPDYLIEFQQNIGSTDDAYRVLGGMAHDLSSFLMSIRMHAQMLGMNATSEQNEFIQGIETGTERIRKYIYYMLDQSRKANKQLDTNT